MKNLRAIILNRSGRKCWYIRCYIADENGDIAKFEESTGVEKTEKTLAYMQNKFLPAWEARKAEESKVKILKTKEFGYFATIFLREYERWHDYQNVEYRVNRILVEFGRKDISKITKLEIKQWLNSLTDPQTGRELSKNSKSKYLRIFHGVFETALDGGVIDRNLTYDIKLVEAAKRELDEIRPFSAEEVQKLLKTTKNGEYGMLIYDYLGIAFNQGMSASEILGLQIGDIDLGKRSVTIRRDVTKGKIKETKTIYRDRTIPIFDSTLPHFENLLHEARRKMSFWLFSKEDGSNLDDIKDIRGDKLIIKDGQIIKKNTKWYRLLEDCQIDHRDLKNCRHTFAVRALESKAFTPQEIANILGHGSLKMLIEHYAKWLKDKAMHADRSINLFGDAFARHG